MDLHVPEHDIAPAAQGQALVGPLQRELAIEAGLGAHQGDRQLRGKVGPEAVHGQAFECQPATRHQRFDADLPLPGDAATGWRRLFGRRGRAHPGREFQAHRRRARVGRPGDALQPQARHRQLQRQGLVAWRLDRLGVAQAEASALQRQGLQRQPPGRGLGWPGRGRGWPVRGPIPGGDQPVLHLPAAVAGAFELQHRLLQCHPRQAEAARGQVELQPLQPELAQARERRAAQARWAAGRQQAQLLEAGLRQAQLQGIGATGLGGGGPGELALGRQLALDPRLQRLREVGRQRGQRQPGQGHRQLGLGRARLAVDLEAGQRLPGLLPFSRRAPQARAQAHRHRGGGGPGDGPGTEV